MLKNSNPEGVFQKRKTIDYDLSSLSQNINNLTSSIINPSAVTLKIPGRQSPVDIGSVAYTERKYDYMLGLNQINYALCQVNDLSFDSSRNIIITRLLEFLLIKYNTTISAFRTVQTYTISFMNFMKWYDLNQRHKFLNKVTFIESIKLYEIYLIEKVKMGQFNQNTLVGYLRHIIQIFSQVFDFPERTLESELKRLRERTFLKTNHSYPDEKSTQIVLSYCESIFLGIFDFVLNNKPFPYLLRLPNEDVYILPSVKTHATKAQLKGRSSWNRAYIAWDYKNGKINTLQEAYNLYDGKKGIAYCQEKISSALISLSKANSDDKYYIRMRLARLAQDCFFVLFVANTGINRQQAVSMEHHTSSTLKSNQAGFKSIKARAKNKVVEFQISSSFLPMYRKFEKIRNYLLNDSNCKYLFTSTSDKTYRFDLKEFIRTKLVLFYDDANKIKLTLAQLRVLKANYLINNASVPLAADMLQNTISTLKKHYVSSNNQTFYSDMANYYHFVTENIVSNNGAELSAGPIGHCKSNATPEKLFKEQLTKPGCRDISGCLHCKHYAIHLDINDKNEPDIWHLLSLKHILQKTMLNSETLTQFEVLHKETLSRIDAITKTISNISSETKFYVQSYINKVLQDDLSPKYMKKLYHLQMIGLVSYE